MSKPKIDLKARLGRRPGVAPASASIPPPVGVHQGPAPSPGPMMGHPGAYVPAPPQPRPSFDALGVAAVQAPPPMRAPAPSAVEVEEEFQAVRKGSRTKVMTLALGTALVGGVLGFAIGGLMERDAAADTAVVGAKELIKEIDAANSAVTQLSDVLSAAAKSLKDGKYPETEVKALGGVNIPFDGSNLAGKGIGRFKPQLVTMLISYAEAASKANTQKDKIRNVLSISKAGVEDLLAQSSNPQVRWGVMVQSGPQGPWGNMQVVPAFAVAGEKGGWPAQLELNDGKNKATVKRYSGGDPSNQIIPIAPQSQANVCPMDTMVRLRRELSDMQKIVNGDETPGQEVQGIVAMGESIKKQLAVIGG